MELKQYWNLILKNLSIVLALTFLGGSLGLLVSLATPKQYKAESQIFISTPTPSIDIGALQQGSSFAQQRVISYARVISGPATLVPVIKTLGLQMNSSELAGKIKPRELDPALEKSKCSRCEVRSICAHSACKKRN